MRSLISALFLILGPALWGGLFLTSCTKNSKFGFGSTPVRDEQSLEASFWSVSRKFCDSEEQTLVGPESILFQSGNFVYTYSALEDPDQICNITMSFTRDIQQSGFDDPQYTETSTVVPHGKRASCQPRHSAGTPSVQSLGTPDHSELTLQLTLSGQRGTADLIGSSVCENGDLHLELTRQ